MSTAASENGISTLRDSHNPKPPVSDYSLPIIIFFAAFYSHQIPNGLIGLYL